LFLYHIPPVSQVPISTALIERLRSACPRRITGLKDSGGDWRYTREVIDRFPEMTVFAGSERFLLDTLRYGGDGCITAYGNINPAGIRSVYGQWHDDAPDVDALQRNITSVRDVLEGYTMIPALKSVCAVHYGDEGWRTVRPPLVALAPDRCSDLLRRLDELGFSMADNAASARADGGGGAGEEA